MYKNCSFKQIIYHDRLPLTTRRNVNEFCIGTLPRGISDFRTFRQVRRSTSSKRNEISVKLFQHWKLLGLFFRAHYLPLLSAAHNSSKYRWSPYFHVTGRNVRFSYFSLSSAIDVVETKKVFGQIFSGLKVIKTVYLSELFTTIVCCSQLVEI